MHFTGFRQLYIFFLLQSEGNVVASGDVSKFAFIKEECFTFKDESIEDNCEVGCNV